MPSQWPERPLSTCWGEVTKPGGYVLDDDSNVEASRLTVMRVMALASGPVHGAALNKSRIIRRTAKGLQELPIRLKQTMAGKAPDLHLQAEDILYVPGGRNGTYISSVLKHANISRNISLLGDPENPVWVVQHLREGVKVLCSDLGGAVLQQMD